MFAKRNGFIFDVRGGKKRKGSTSSKFTQRKQREQGRLHKKGKRRARSFSLCEDEEDELQKKEERIKKELERIINISETAKKRSEQQKQ